MLIVLSGPSGVGKDSVLRQLATRVQNLALVVTATTRPPRPGEVPDTSYHFISREEYERRLQGGEFLAPAQVHGHWYGAPLASIRQALERGQDVLLKIDVQGALALRAQIPSAIFVFLAPPSFRDLVLRLRSRQTEGDGEVDTRLRDAQFELEQAAGYDYLVVNVRDDLECAVRDLQCIIQAERLRTHRLPVELPL